MRRSSSPAIRCCTRRRRCTRSSSTRRCIRRRCSTCGISCRTSRSGRRPNARADRAARRPSPARVAVPAGRATLGARPGEIPFGWDNEFPGLVVDVPAFEIDVHDVTNEQFMEFVDAGGYRQPEWWTPDGLRLGSSGGHRASALLDAPQTARGSGAACSRRSTCRPRGRCTSARRRQRRTPAGRARACRPKPSTTARPSANRQDSERQYPWGDAPPDASRGLFDFASWNPVAVGRHPAGQSAWGVHDLMGNGWEWTSTAFAPFDGFRPMASYPEYSADFFDGQHVVMKGASPATDAALLRRSFRNWFRPNYPYVYATFRCVRTDRVADERHALSRSSIGSRRGRQRAVGRPRRAARVRAGRPVLPAAGTRGNCRRDSCTTRSARRCSTRSVICRGTASREPSCSCFSGTRRRSDRSSGTADEWSNWGAATARSSRRC